MFLDSKSGQLSSQLIVIILTVAAFLVVGGVLTEKVAKAEDKDAEVLCHDSVALRMATALQINPQGKADEDYFRLVEATIKPAPVLCKTIEKEIEGDRTKVKRAIADKIASCWYMFGEGRYERTLEGSKVKILPSLFNFGEAPNTCFNCYTLLVGDIKGGEISSQEMMEFLSTEIHKKSGKTFTEYIQRVGGPGRIVYYVVNPETFTVEGIKPNHAYSVSILPKLPPVEEGKITSGVVKIGFAAGGTAAGAVIVGVLTASGPLGWTAMAVGVGVSTLLGVTGYSGVNDLVQAYYADSEFRQVSSIYVSTLRQGQQWCGSGDIAGR